MNHKIVKNTQKSLSKIGGKSIGKFSGKAGKGVIQNLNPLAVLQEYFSYKKATEQEVTHRQEIISKREIAVTAILAQKEVIEKYFQLRFEERSSILSEFFTLLHHAINERDSTELDTALNGILDLVRESPLKDFETFRHAYTEGKTIEI